MLSNLVPCVALSITTSITILTANRGRDERCGRHPTRGEGSCWLTEGVRREVWGMFVLDASPSLALRTHGYTLTPTPNDSICLNIHLPLFLTSRFFFSPVQI